MKSPLFGMNIIPLWTSGVGSARPGPISCAQTCFRRATLPRLIWSSGL
jgi:hypothetical protein